MKGLLAGLEATVSRTLRPPADPRTVMGAFCRAMSEHRGRPVELVFRAFPEDLPVSGMRLDCGDRSLIVVEERTPPESQLVILGHELWHEERGGCGHHVPGLSAAAARAFAPASEGDIVRRAVREILAGDEISRRTLLAVAARAGSADRHEQDAETFGLLFGREALRWIPGRHARGPVDPDTLEGRIQLCCPPPSWCWPWR
ncbi:toxin [Streptomyces bauhiniae]|uniref:Toxin n=2 Tax=Streptomyces bauhiniae TaxID=2340725 RepID=A0A4Z1D9X0_9ACTN|nr:toxin [Streptomyces bauhiniae]